MGKTLAARAEVTDAHGPVLHRYDRWGYDVGEVVHHPTWTANKADLVRTGFVGLDHHSGPCRPGGGHRRPRATCSASARPPPTARSV